MPPTARYYTPPPQVKREKIHAELELNWGDVCHLVRISCVTPEPPMIILSQLSDLFFTGRYRRLELFDLAMTHIVEERNHTDAIR